jgi:hypothetical protein
MDFPGVLVPDVERTGMGGENQIVVHLNSELEPLAERLRLGVDLDRQIIQVSSWLARHDFSTTAFRGAYLELSHSIPGVGAVKMEVSGQDVLFPGHQRACLD